MCCFTSGPIDVEAKARNDRINDELKRDRQKARHEVKMLLLGAGESGKSTILKQMKLIHLGGYSEQERDSYREIVFSNTVQSIRVILEALPVLGLELSHENDPYRSTIFAQPLQFDSDALPKEVGVAIVNLWRDPAIKHAVARSCEFQLNDSATYFFDSIERIVSPNYIPSDQDILRTRVKTTGITETTFKANSLTYKLFDVGGQRSERKKWIHCFEDVNALVFMVSLSEYDQVLYEDQTVNRMQEALTLFDSICNSRWFLKTSIILFLNKTDLFREKLTKSPLVNYFPEYDGPATDYTEACSFFRRQFIGLNQNPEKDIYTDFTCATDTKQIQFVLDSVMTSILKSHLVEFGLM